MPVTTLKEWSTDRPIYRQIRERVVALILEGALKDGDALPSVRSVAAESRLNPLTVLKGYQELVDEKLVETRRGRIRASRSAQREVKVGDRVTSGQVLAACGNSGNSSEPHLHFQMQDGLLFERSWGMTAVFDNTQVIRDGKPLPSAAYELHKGDLVQSTSTR